MAELRRQIEYKAAWSGVHMHVADRWYPSSKTCSACGVVKAKLCLSERTYTCDQCGIVLDRDLNAARNLAALVSVVTDGDGGELRRDSPMETHIRPALRGHRGTATGRPPGSTSAPQGAGSGHGLHVFLNGGNPLALGTSRG